MLTENQECTIFAKYLRSKKILFTKIASEIWTPSFNQIRKQKLEWLWKWVPDYVIIVPKQNWKKELVFIEMKRKDWWQVSIDQKRWIYWINEAWIKAKVCKWAIEAINFILYVQWYGKTE